MHSHIQPHSHSLDIFQGCFSKPISPAAAWRESGLSEAANLRWADKHVSGHSLRAGLQLTAEADRLSHVHCVEVCGVTSSGPPLPQVQGLLPMVRMGFSSHF